MAGVKHPLRFEVYWVKLDPTVGSEIAKTRPCIVVSPDALNARLHTVLVVPLTSIIRDYPMRPILEILGKKSQAVTDQLRSVDKSRLMKSMGKLTPAQATSLLQILQEMFAR